MAAAMKAAEKQKKQLPPLPTPDFSDRSKSMSLPALNSSPVPSGSAHGSQGTSGAQGGQGSQKKKGKRSLDKDSPDSSLSKKKRVASPGKTHINSVTPQPKVSIEFLSALMLG